MLEGFKVDVAIVANNTAFDICVTVKSKTSLVIGRISDRTVCAVIKNLLSKGSNKSDGIGC